MHYKYNISFLLIIVGFLLPLPVVSQSNTYSFEQIDSLQKIEKRKVIVFIHTDWCKYCQSMKNTTLKNNDVVKLINENFWFALLNAEEKNNIVFNQHTFKYKPTGNNTGVNELTEHLGTIDGKITYPVMCVLNEDYEIVFQYNQFLNSAELLKLLNELIKKKIMEYAIEILEHKLKTIEMDIKGSRLMESDIRFASQELSKITKLKKAIKVLKNKAVFSIKK